MASISLDDLDLILDDKEVNAPPLFDKNEHVEAITPSIKEEMMTKTDLEFGLPTELNLKVELADDAPPPSKIDKNITEALMFDVAEPANKINSDDLEFVMDKSDFIATEEFKIPKDKTIALSNPTLMDLNSIDFASPAADTTKELMQVKDTRTVEAIGANEIDGFFQTKPDNSPVVDVHSTTTIANSLLNELMADFPDLMSNNSAIEQISLAKQYVALGDSGAAIDMLKHVIETTNSSADKVAAEEALQEITG